VWGRVDVESWMVGFLVDRSIGYGEVRLGDVMEPGWAGLCRGLLLDFV
jgi:hypothetical protein